MKFKIKLSKSPALPVILATTVGLVAVSGDSFWIDEGLSATKATTLTIGGAWSELRTEANTNMHMLLYMFCLWSWEKLFGSSEWAMRAMNIPFFVLGVVSLWFAVRKEQCLFVLVLCLSSPFLWFYLNEARPYMMVFGLSAVVTSSIVYWLENRHRSDFPWTLWTWTISVSCGLLAWTHVVGLVFELWAALLLLALAGFKGIWHIFLRAPWAVITVTASNVVLVAYVVWTKSQGVDANPLGSSGLLGALFCVYEFGGFAGLGPDRIQLRASALEAFGKSAVPLALLALSWAGVFFFAWRGTWVKERRTFLSIGLFLIALPLATFLLLGHLQDTRFVPRHATPSYPAFIVIVAILLSNAWSLNMRGKVAVGVLISLLLSSSLHLRFSAVHHKDDYRAATAQALASLQAGAHVWWGGDLDTARYYGLPNPAETPRDQRSFETATELRSSMGRTPDIVYLSKFDIYDPTNLIRRFVEKHGYQQSTGPKTFTIWEKPSKTSTR